MFEFDAGKLLIIAVAALIFIGPKDLPRVMRQVGQAVGRLRRMGADFQAQFMDAMNEAGAEDIKAGVSTLSDSAKINLDFDPMKIAKSETLDLTRQIEAPVGAPAARGPVTAPEKDIESEPSAGRAVSD
jgi:sec-independent protein translocase protein TatB